MEEEGVTAEKKNTNGVKGERRFKPFLFEFQVIKNIHWERRGKRGAEEKESISGEGKGKQALYLRAGGVLEEVSI